MPAVAYTLVPSTSTYAMKNTVLLLMLTLLFGISLTAQDKVRYTQSAQEIDLIKELEAAYNAGNWEKFVSYYHADAVADHNGTTVNPKGLAAGMQATIEECSYYSLNLPSSELERIINDRGEVWVNAWGSWQGVLKGSTDTIKTSVHVAFEFKGSKIAREFAMYDNLGMSQAMAVASMGKDQLLYIIEDHIESGSEASYSEIVGNYIKALNDSKVAGMHWICAVSEDKSIALHQNNINSLMDLQRLQDEGRRSRMVVDREKLQEINGAFLNNVTNRKEYVVRRHATRSYWPTEGFDGDVGYMNMMRMTVAPKDYFALMSLANEAVKISKDAKSPLPFGFFTFEIGGSMTEFVVVEYALSAADYATRKAKEEQLFAKGAGKAWNEKIEEVVASFNATKLRVAPQISRMGKR